LATRIDSFIHSFINQCLEKENEPKIIRKEKIYVDYLNQGWPTQTGLWAAIRKISKNIDFLGQFLTKTVEKHSKYRKVSTEKTFLPKWLEITSSSIFPAI
jgi:hypothetical protein